MGFDQVTWAPRIGAAGDDKYDVPGSTKLDGSVDVGDPTVIAAGSSAFSATPTIAEINASSGVNQVLGLLNRRILQYNTLFGTAMNTLPYVAADADVRRFFQPSGILVAQTAINALRNIEGFSQYVFTGNQNAGQLIKGFHLAELRKALGLYGTLTLEDVRGNIAWDTYRRDDAPYGTLAAETLGALNVAGKSGNLAAMSRYRMLFTFNIPDWLIAAASVDFNQDIADLIVNFEAYTPEVWMSDTDDYPASFAAAYNFDTLIGTMPALVGSYTFAMDPADIVARAGTRLSAILCTDLERTQTGDTAHNVSNLWTGFPEVIITL